MLIRIVESSHNLFRPFQKYLRHHLLATFRTLLVSGVILLIALLWYTHSLFSYQQPYYFWLAGLSATLGILFLFTMISTALHGYHYMRDIWLKVAMITMFGLSATLVMAAVSHAP